MKRKFAFVGGLASLVVVIDQLVKWEIVRFFKDNEYATHPVIPGTFDLILTHNTGAAWGILGDLKPDSLRIAVFILINIGAMAMVGWMAMRAKSTQRLLLVALSLVLGGALGNLTDRLVAGRVVDFLDFYTRAAWFESAADFFHNSCNVLIGCHWPAFNVADICITTGVSLLVLETFIAGRKKEPPAATADAPAGQAAGTVPPETVVPPVETPPVAVPPPVDGMPG